MKAEGHPRDRVTEGELDRQVLALFDRMHIDDPEARTWIEKVLRARTLKTGWRRRRRWPRPRAN